MTADEFSQLLGDLYGDGLWPKPLHLLQGLAHVVSGMKVQDAAKLVGTSAARLQHVLGASDPLEATLGLGFSEIEEKQLLRHRLILGQLLLGRAAELAFEDLYRIHMRNHEFELEDLRESRNDTDYRVYDGQGRPVYRINIKFYGSRFRKAPELVGLDTNDSFALATYKIHSALQKQDQEHLPYFFAIIGVPGLTGEEVGKRLPLALVQAVAYVHLAPRGQGKRSFEDAVVSHIVDRRLAEFDETLQRILEAEWFILSARKADLLLRKLLFERVFGLRVRGFARVFRGAELDMHFSLSRDLVPLKDFLRVLSDEGPTKVATLLERGDY